MTTRSAANATIGHLCRQLGLEAATLNEEDWCALEVEGLEIYVCYLESLDGAILLNAPLGPLPADRPELALELLRANHPAEATSGIWLSLEPDSDLVTLSGLIALAALDGPAAFEAFEVFLEQARHWRDEIANGPAGPADATPPGLMPGALMG